jgi:hypothetical protein
VLQLPTSLSGLPRLELVYIDDRTTPFYPNPRFFRFQKIITVLRDDEYPYRRSQ